jgi:hypothetical protein
MRSHNPAASNFLAAGIAVVAASLCYAKITPAALRRGKIRERRDEAAVRHSKFELIDFRLPIADAGRRSREHLRWQQVKQGMPDA